MKDKIIAFMILLDFVVYYFLIFRDISKESWCHYRKLKYSGKGVYYSREPLVL